MTYQLVEHGALYEHTVADLESLEFLERRSRCDVISAGAFVRVSILIHLILGDAFFTIGVKDSKGS